MPKYKIAVGLITNDCKVHWGMVASLLEIISSGATEYELTPIFYGGIYIDKLRNNVAGDFLETDCDFLLLLDYDNGIHPDGLGYFMKDFEDPNVNIVSGRYVFKGSEDKLVSGITTYACNPGFYEFLPKDGFPNELINLSHMGKGAMVGAGCLMIRRKVFEEVPFPWFQTEWRHQDGGCSMTGEDTFFCEKASEYGFDIHLDQRIKSPHYWGTSCYPSKWNQVKP